MNHGVESSDPSSSPEKEPEAVPVAMIPLVSYHYESIEMISTAILTLFLMETFH